jgi:FAD-dependent urate hydroxylase
VQIIGTQGSLGLWPAGGCDLQWWFDLKWTPDFVRPERPIDVIRSNFAGWSEAVDDVLARLTDDDLAASPFPHFRHPNPRAPRSSAVTLLGDAAHTMPPVLAQGTNQALLDTMVLRHALWSLRAGSVERNGDLPGALRWYEKTRRRRLAAVSWTASRPVSQNERVLRYARIPDSLATLMITVLLRATSHRRIAAACERVRPNRAGTTHS